VVVPAAQERIQVRQPADSRLRFRRQAYAAAGQVQLLDPQQGQGFEAGGVRRVRELHAVAHVQIQFRVVAE
jgi:hypothetical protein